MSAPGEAKDVCASGAKQRLEEPVREHGRPMLGGKLCGNTAERALRRARRRVMPAADAQTRHERHDCKEAAA